MIDDGLGFPLCNCCEKPGSTSRADNTTFAKLSLSKRNKRSSSSSSKKSGHSDHVDFSDISLGMEWSPVPGKKCWNSSINQRTVFEIIVT